METFVPWAALCALIEPHYPKVENGRPSVDVERMLRMYLIANWINLADEACEDALYDIPAFRDFCWIDLGRERVPDATTLLNFCRLLEGRRIGAALFPKFGVLLQSNGMKLSGGTIVDAALIAAPPSTKIREQARDFTNKRAYRNRPLTDADKEANRKKSCVRSKVEHPFLTLKHLWGSTKARYRGLSKNANRDFAMFALINLTKWGVPLMRSVPPA